MFNSKILLDSIAPNGRRLTTWELTYPRMVHAELMTHRVFSRNSASSRAIPYPKMRQRVLDDPVIPVWWGLNEKGMQAFKEHPDPKACEEWWLRGRDMMVAWANEGHDKLGLHKQIVNRGVEAWMWITVIVSTTYHTNWYKLRDHKAAEPHIRKLAGMMVELFRANKPVELKEGDWHKPLTFDEDVGLLENLDPGFAFIVEPKLSDTILRYDKSLTEVGLIQVSTGRCARVSYLTHDGKRDIKEDIRLHNDLASTAVSEDPGHFSPFEHCAMALSEPKRIGNYCGWLQYRKFFRNEHAGEPSEFDSISWAA